MQKYSKEFIETIWEDKIKNNLTLSDLKIKYFSTVDYWLKKYQFYRPDLKIVRSRHKIDNFNWNGSSINNEIEAYIVGLLMSDGYVLISNGMVGIRLTEKGGEFDLLTKINNYLLKVPKELKINKKNVVNYKVYSYEFMSNIISLGIVPNKTYSNLHIPKMDESLIRHFIRGYFDGDGSIFYDRKWLKCNICSISETILLEIQHFLFQNNIESTINVEKRANKQIITPQNTIITNAKDMYRLYIRKQKEIKKFKVFLYKDSTIYLKRKFDKFETKDNTELIVDSKVQQ